MRKKRPCPYNDEDLSRITQYNQLFFSISKICIKKLIFVKRKHFLVHSYQISPLILCYFFAFQSAFCLFFPHMKKLYICTCKKNVENSFFFFCPERAN
jgi:hypothetical protein